MGFDIYGMDPQTEKGHYFRNNVWYWRPLWQLICEECDDILTEEQMASGSYNDGVEVSAEQAMKIFKRLVDKAPEIEEDVLEYEKARQKAAEKDPKDFSTHYPLTSENVWEFAEFCKESGGFSIH